MFLASFGRVVFLARLRTFKVLPRCAKWVDMHQLLALKVS